MKRRVAFMLRGRVQGVGFRWSARHEAQSLGVTGWIRNISSGDAVCGEVEGEASAVDAFIAWCKQGPPGARVDLCEINDQKFQGNLVGFEVRRSSR